MREQRAAQAALVALVTLAACTLATSCGSTTTVLPHDAAADAGPPSDSAAVDGPAGDVAPPSDAADAQVGPVCNSAAPLEPLGAPEAFVTGREDLARVGAADSGPVWVEVQPVTNMLTVLTAPMGTVQVVYEDSTFGEPGALRVLGDTFALSYSATWGLPYHGAGSQMVVWGGIAPQASFCGSGAASDEFGLDDAHVYVFEEYVPGLRRYPLGGDCGAPSPVPDVMPDVGGRIAVDTSGIYLFNQDAPGSYMIQRIERWGDAPVTLASNVPGPPSTNGLMASNGNLFWRVEGMSRVYELPNGASVPHVLVDDPDGVWGFAADAESVYWASGDGWTRVVSHSGWTAPHGTVKRISRCGGTPEVLASGQRWNDQFREPIGITVGDNAVYWLTGDGKVMRMRKLGAPGHPDASMDAGISDASAGDADAGD